MARHYFSLHQKAPGHAWQATFCRWGITEPFGTGTSVYRDAWRKCEEVEPTILARLKLAAALKGKNVGADEVVAPREMDLSLDGSGGIAVPPLVESSLAPRGSLLEWIDKRVQWLFSHGQAKTKSSKDRVKRARTHLVEGLGMFMHKPKSAIGVIEGELMVRYFNDPIRFPKSGPVYVTAVKYLLEPLIKNGELSEQFYECLSRVEQQSKESNSSDPFLKSHFQLMRTRLNTGLEEDYHLGLYLLGGAAGPQIIEPALLQWEGVDFKNNEIRFFRQKTVVLARFKMTPDLRAWLEKRRRKAAADDVYVFWELVSLHREVTRGGFNKIQINDNYRSRSIGTLANQEWRGFLHRCGIPVNYSIFFPGDVVDLSGFVAKLRAKSDPLSTWLVDQFNPKGQKAVAKSASSIVPDLEGIVIRNLNTILKEQYIFDENRCAHVQLRAETKQLLHPKLTEERLHHANRLVFEDAYPELRKATYTSLNYSYSSFRKHYVSFIRGVGLPDEFCLLTCGHDALSSQGDYSTVAEHVLDRGAEVVGRHIKAMEENLPEFYPITPLDLYEGVQDLLRKSDEKHQQRYEEMRATAELWQRRYEEAQSKADQLRQSLASNPNQVENLAREIAKSILAKINTSGDREWATEPQIR